MLLCVSFAPVGPGVGVSSATYILNLPPTISLVLSSYTFEMVWMYVTYLPSCRVRLVPLDVSFEKGMDCRIGRTVAVCA